MTDLFEHAAERDRTGAPLPDRLRPTSLDDLVGQEHLVGPDRVLRRLIQGDRLPSLILWGPPGTGKTTLARIVARSTRHQFVPFSAVMGGVKDLREIVRAARDRLHQHRQRTILFIDEIHRFNKGQQDALLPHVERGIVTLIGATTENPSFELNAALLSRCRVLTLKPLEPRHIAAILDRGAALMDAEVDAEARDFLVQHSQGDARRALTALEMAALADRHLTLKGVEEALQTAALRHDKSGEMHYDVVSAFIKSMRGSDPDGAIYWMSRMLEAGEDPRFILRRMIILASEDVGNADPQGLQMAVAAAQAFEWVGMPEGAIPMAQACTYLAQAPKSNAAYKALKESQAEVRASGTLAVPMHLRNAPTGLMRSLGYGEGYKYAHDYAGKRPVQQHLPDALAGRRFYRPEESAGLADPDAPGAVGEPEPVD